MGLGKKGKLKGDLEVLSVGLGKWWVRRCTMAESLLTPSHGDSGWGLECSSPPCWAPTCYPSSSRSRSLHCCEMVMLLLLLLLLLFSFWANQSSFFFFTLILYCLCIYRSCSFFSWWVLLLCLVSVSVSVSLFSFGYWGLSCSSLFHMLKLLPFQQYWRTHERTKHFLTVLWTGLLSS